MGASTSSSPRNAMWPRSQAGAIRSFRRIIAEPELAAPIAGWRWCAADRHGFVRLPDGSAFPVDDASGGVLPSELAVALQRAHRDNAPPREVVVESTATDAELATWTRETGVRFIRGASWQWDHAPAERFAAATDLLQGAFAMAPRGAPAHSLSRVLAPAVALAAVAASVHVAAAVADWAAANVDAWRQARAWTELARSAGLADAHDPASSKDAIARRHAELRHAHGLAAASDALPLLARAAPAIATLPIGTLRNATYADDHWTFELSRLDPPSLARLDAALRNAGTPALAATSEAATRVRIAAP